MRKILHRTWHLITIFSVSVGVFSTLSAQDKREWAPWEKFKPSFSVQSDMLFSLDDKAAGNKSWMGNSYVTGTLRNNYLELGLRYEDLLRPMLGHEPEQGRGIPHLHLKGYVGKYAEVTLGDFYDQFGSGILFRSYEERTLGIDNAVRGAHVLLTPYDGIRVKGFVGQQRNYFDRTARLFTNERGYIRGGDGELAIQQWVPSMRDKRMTLSVGGSYINKVEGDEIIPVATPPGMTGAMRLNLPRQVHAFGGRAKFSVGNWAFNGEYAYKSSDPTASNHYIYSPGSVAMLSTSYSRKGLSLLLQAKRSKNFNFLSARSSVGTPLHINHLPAFTANHTYTLAALYPYATQPDGEWAFQGDFRYTIPRGSLLGGKYGTGIRVNYAHVRGLKNVGTDRLPLDAPEKDLYGTDGYSHPFFGMGQLYYSDLNIELSKKFSRTVSVAFNYYHQIYNQQVVEGHAINNPLVYSNIFVLDGKFKLAPNYTLRTELQYLNSRQAEGSWLFGLAELSIAPKWMISLSDQYNMTVTKQHYYMGTVAYSAGNHRVQLGYGRTRAGINCSGGVCRYMPETKGIYLTYNGTF